MGPALREGTVDLVPSLVQSQSKSVAWVVQVWPFIIGNLGSSVTQLHREMGLSPAGLALHKHPSPLWNKLFAGTTGSTCSAQTQRCSDAAAPAQV